MPIHLYSQFKREKKRLKNKNQNIKCISASLDSSIFSRNKAAVSFLALKHSLQRFSFQFVSKC